jgi:hypothetical protein
VNFVLPFFPATASYYFIERPFIGIGRRLERRLQMRAIRQPADVNPEGANR